VARLEDLTTLREQLQEWLVDAPVDRKAALVAQYRATLAEIAELTPKEAQGDGIDEIAARRSERRARAAKAAGSSKRSG
jgi:uncharacterized phage protein gp47/JayE